MRRAVADQILALIDEYDLHATLPVKLTPLEDRFWVHYRPLVRSHHADGMLFPPRDVPITPSNPAVVLLDCDLNDHRERLTYAHEIGHALCGHLGAFAYQGMDPWFRRRLELEAWEAGAALLIPWYTWFGDLESVAQRCHVPRWLVRMVSQSEVH